ncbi:MAG: DnaB-like helicase C-terminal domain-containing protein, partial [Patescibacteria group bacterium]|nr:DnaB-like helicase C-terminal domain-containing protein [Patescibacteria group bacterium]
VLGAIDRMEAAHQRGGAVSGLATGFPDFDKLTGGLQPGEMIVIAARPSVGKSSLAMNIADHVAVDLRLPVGVISLEMTAQSLVSRLLCSRARVNLANIRDGFLAERDFPKITAAAAKLKDAPLYIDDTRGQTVLQIRAKFRRWWQQHRIKLGIIDYLQLATAGGRWESRQQEVAAISCGVRNIAGELGIPILVLAQLNRDVEREKSRKPRLSDLRESGSIEADADLVGFLYRPEREDDSESEEACPVNLLIAKQRNGPTGDIPLTFLRQFTRFESAARISRDEPSSRQMEGVP